MIIAAKIFEECHGTVSAHIERKYRKYYCIGKFSEEGRGKYKDTTYLLHRKGDYVLLTEKCTGNNGGTPNCCLEYYYEITLLENEMENSDSESSDSE